MTRTFIEVPSFTKKWHDYGLTDENLRELQKLLLADPKYGKSIAGTGGLRKIRVPMETRRKGKRSGARVLYVDIELKEKIYFINVYSKDEQSDLSPDEKKTFKQIIKLLKEE